MKQQGVVPKAIYSVLGGAASSYKFVKEFSDAANGVLDVNHWFNPKDKRAWALKKKVDAIKDQFFTYEVFLNYQSVYLLVDAIERAKSELVEALPDDGVAILNADDERVERMRDRTRARVRTYGFSSNADVTAERIESAGADGMRFVLRVGGRRHPVRTPALGRHAVHNGLAAAAVGVEAGLTLDEIARGLADGWSAPHRSELVHVGGVSLLDDTYNASPESVRAALAFLAETPVGRGRRLAVLGDMLELGPSERALHEAIGARAAEVLDGLVAVGDRGRWIADAARAAGLARVDTADDADQALAAVERALSPRAGDLLLVKGSRGIALDRLVAALLGRSPDEDA